MWILSLFIVLAWEVSLYLGPCGLFPSGGETADSQIFLECNSVHKVLFPWTQEELNNKRQFPCLQFQARTLLQKHALALSLSLVFLSRPCDDSLHLLSPGFLFSFFLAFCSDCSSCSSTKKYPASGFAFRLQGKTLRSHDSVPAPALLCWSTIWVVSLLFQLYPLYSQNKGAFNCSVI